MFEGGEKKISYRVSQTIPLLFFSFSFHPTPFPAYYELITNSLAIDFNLWFCIYSVY